MAYMSVLLLFMENVIHCFVFFYFTNEHNRVSFSEHEIKAAVFARRQKYMKVCVDSIICSLSLKKHCHFSP